MKTLVHSLVDFALSVTTVLHETLEVVCTYACMSIAACSAVQMFGPYAALKLAELSEGVVLDCLSQLDECLSRWQNLLDPVTMAVVVSQQLKTPLQGCVKSMNKACGQHECVVQVPQTCCVQLCNLRND